jgi:hypothetical protein
MKTSNQIAAQGNKFDDSTPSSDTNQSPESCIFDDTSFLPKQTLGQSGVVCDNCLFWYTHIKALRMVLCYRGAL